MVKVAYPVANSRNDLSPLLLSLKIARHAPCTLCTCQGLHPSQGVTVVSDNRDVYEEADDFDDDEDPQSYLEGCECGHDIVAHNASEAELGRAEWARRGNVGIRIDEILQDSGRLFDFRYTDEDTNSLRKQMIIPGTASASSSTRQAPSSPDRTHSVPLTLSSSPGSGGSESSLSEPESQNLPAKRRRARSSSSLSDADFDTTRDDRERCRGGR
ncbi:hypothetical protein FA13DRAFT_1630790 [Coprinellus micaceus]|uniref:Uncharacterized protein n=1 Tax=Coprinellus micaceus TaxID=71717 RepID=A0A4Y7T839_COPMI|nr:hypothetical protein FA13DRAFT_1630790 [Coprinellus micaceus]